MYSTTADRADHHGLAAQVWGRLAAGLDRADLIEPRARPIGVRKPVLRGSLSVPSTRPSCSMHRQHSGRVSPGRTLSPEGGRAVRKV
jgi:hypothetical protein